MGPSWSYFRDSKQNGGAVISGPAAQMTETIQRGVVDGFVGIPASTAVAFNAMPHAKSVTRTPLDLHGDIRPRQ